MPYCPKCRAEYREGFTECADCEVALVDELPEAEEQESEFREHPETVALENPVVLETFVDTVEFMYVASMLDKMDIPYTVRTKGGASIKGIYTFQNTIEKTIYVEDADYEKSRGGFGILGLHI